MDVNHTLHDSTSFIIFIAIQLLPPFTSRSNNRGTRGRKSFGRRQPSSHTTLIAAAVTLESSSSFIRTSLIFGQVGRRVSGYTSAKRYKVTNVFLRMLGLECIKRGNRSPRSAMANDGVIMCGSVTNGRDIVAIEADEISCSAS